MKASAFARNKSTGAWTTAYLGSYGPGLGVTDNTESGADPTHKVDNIGSNVNYVLLEFSAPVVLNRAFLESVGTDSDITVWIGTKTNPFANHVGLSDAVSERSRLHGGEHDLLRRFTLGRRQRGRPGGQLHRHRGAGIRHHRGRRIQTRQAGHRLQVDLN